MRCLSVWSFSSCKCCNFQISSEKVAQYELCKRFHHPCPCSITVWFKWLHFPFVSRLIITTARFFLADSAWCKLKHADCEHIWYRLTLPPLLMPFSPLSPEPSTHFLFFSPPLNFLFKYFYAELLLLEKGLELYDANMQTLNSWEGREQACRFTTAAKGRKPS